MLSYYRNLFLLIAIAIPGYCTNLFLINGPGGEAYGNKTTSSVINAFGSRVRALNGQFGTIGDGVRPIEIDLLRDNFEQFSEKVETPLVLIHSHGEAKRGEFFLKLGNNWIPNSELLDTLIDNCNNRRPISILYAACYGNTATTDASGLPTGSVLVGFSGQQATERDVQRWFDAVTSTWPVEISALGLLEAFLLRGLKNRLSPKIALVTTTGTKEYVLNDLFLQTLHKQIPQAVIEKVKSYSNAGTDLEALAQKIATAQHENSIYAAEYGAALALTLENELQNLAAAGIWPGGS